MAARGRGRDAYVTTHLLVALDKARWWGGRKRRANRYYYNFVEQGEAHAARRLKQPPLSCAASERGASMQTASAEKKSISIAFQAGPAGFVKP